MKQSMFLKGLKRKHSPRKSNRVGVNSTKVGQGDGLVDRGFDVAKKRAEQRFGGKPNGTRSKYALMIKRNEQERQSKVLHS